MTQQVLQLADTVFDFVQDIGKNSRTPEIKECYTSFFQRILEITLSLEWLTKKNMGLPRCKNL